MEFSLARSLEILGRTPAVLSALLSDLSEEWILAKEVGNTWNVKEIVAHLVICEQTNWMVRIKIILSDGLKKTFVPIDMHAHFKLAENTSLEKLLKDFNQLRIDGIDDLKNLNLKESDFNKTGIHPTLGEVYLRELVSTWVTHDMSHIAQVTRIIAKQNKDNVGSFAAFLKILNT
ncbi:DinB family protein [Sporocytophaga myxococcoides]|uniref:DinB family protein n=1 Tax=Sporocytophaga myxococcoides TaxID=153721 RepID=UPI00040EF4F8|nr:DinB family protein [Sporocytophaga myxococcoides]